MTEIHRCDRLAAHDGLTDALFAGQPPLTVQTARGQLELCPDCADAFQSWWDPETEGESGETIRDHVEGTDGPD